MNSLPLPEKIRRFRSLNGISQESFARKLGVGWNSVQRWESGKVLPSHLGMSALSKFIEDIYE